MAPPQVWKAGQRVTLVSAARRVSASVLLSAENGVSLLVGFDTVLHGHVGGMALFWEEPFGYRSILTQQLYELVADEPGKPAPPSESR